MFNQAALVDLFMLVSRTVVSDEVDLSRRRRLPVQELQERQPLLVVVPRHARADNLTRGDVECGKQRRRPIPFVVVRHGSAAAALEGQPGLGTVERLDLALLVRRKDDRVLRRMKAQPNDCFELLGEERVVAHLERPEEMRLEAVGPPDPADSRLADAHLSPRLRIFSSQAEVMRRAAEIALELDERQFLEKLVRSPRTPVRLVLRSSVILLAADGTENRDIAKALRIARGTVGKWRSRFAEDGFPGIEKDAARPGRRKKYSRSKVAEFVRRTTQEKPAGETHWSRKTMARDKFMELRRGPLEGRDAYGFYGVG